jgi:ABC-type Mn2+/Zn2+ transport system permease subunit
MGLAFAHRLRAHRTESTERNTMALIAGLLGILLAFSSMILSYYILTPKKRDQKRG